MSAVTELRRPAAGSRPTDRPFLVALADREGDVALCYPADRITHAFLYVLDDRTTIYGEGRHVNDGSGWRQAGQGEFDGRVIGRVVSLHGRNGAGWFTYGSGELSG